MNQLSSTGRNHTKEQMMTQHVDLLIIGGGITGAGIALDAASRGMKTTLVEKQDFAAGTSSRSTKLIHGGLRYLQQFEVKMVADVGKERAIVYENGPHVTTPEWMLLPFHKGGNLGPLTTRVGLTLYDYLAGVSKSERKEMLTKEEVLQKEPLIKAQKLKGAGYYVEYKTDDARLTIEVLKKAAFYGASLLNYTEATDLYHDEDGKLTEIGMTDRITGETYSIKAKKVINATGPWVDTLRDKDGHKSDKSLLLTKGVHLVFDQQIFPLQSAVYFNAPDERMIFAIPRGRKTYVGTTDTAYNGGKSNPRVTKEDRDYLIHTLHTMFPALDVNESDVESSWAGLRVLITTEGKDDLSEISRKDEIFISDSGLISIAGGKLTGYRKMAEEIVDLVRDQLKKEIGILYSESETRHIPISGGDVGGSIGFAPFVKAKLQKAEKLGIPEIEAAELIKRYGSNVDELFSIYIENKQDAEKRRINAGLLAELIYAMEFEAAYTPSDFLIRRTGMIFFDREKALRVKEAVMDYMAMYLDWSESEKTAFKAEVEKQLDAAITFL